ncbi:MAG: response regulator transcription factor, partial [Limisphaerales bacterium]
MLMSPVETETIRLLLVEDHEVTRVGLRTLLQGFPQFEIVGETGSVADSLAALTRCQPDVVLL